MVDLRVPHCSQQTRAAHPAVVQVVDLVVGVLELPTKTLISTNSLIPWTNHKSCILNYWIANQSNKEVVPKYVMLLFVAYGGKERPPPVMIVVKSRDRR